MTHEDEKLLARIDLEAAKIHDKLADKIHTISGAEKHLGELYQDYSKVMTVYVRKLRDKSKQMEVLAREERSGINDDEVKSVKSRVLRMDDKIKMVEGYYDRLKDLALQKKGMIKRMKEYDNLIRVNAKLRNTIVNLGLKIEKEKSKMVAADSLSRTEDTLKDVEREFERNKKDLDKKMAQLEEEQAEVNKIWNALKNCIEDFE
ncbi:MAG: hypothetical protein ACTSVU_09425 [Promethearchaeota archaeon]